VILHSFGANSTEQFPEAKYSAVVTYVRAAEFRIACSDLFIYDAALPSHPPTNVAKTLFSIETAAVMNSGGTTEGK